MDTIVICDSKTCKSNFNGVCVAKRIKVRDDEVYSFAICQTKVIHNAVV